MEKTVTTLEKKTKTEDSKAKKKSFFSVVWRHIWKYPGPTLALSSEVTSGGLKAIYRTLGIKPKLSTCKARTTPAILSFWPKINKFGDYYYAKKNHLPF